MKAMRQDGPPIRFGREGREETREGVLAASKQTCYTALPIVLAGHPGSASLPVRRGSGPRDAWPSGAAVTARRANLWKEEVVTRDL